MWPFSIHHYHHGDPVMTDLLTRIFEASTQTRKEVKRMSETTDAIREQIAETNAAIVAEKAEIGAKIDALNAKIESMGSAATETELQEILSDLSTLKGKVQDISEPAVPASPAPETPAEV